MASEMVYPLLPLFLTQVLGYRRWSLRGKVGVEAEAQLFGLAYQLRKVQSLRVGQPVFVSAREFEEHAAAAADWHSALQRPGVQRLDIRDIRGIAIEVERVHAHIVPAQAPRHQAADGALSGAGGAVDGEYGDRLVVGHCHGLIMGAGGVRPAVWRRLLPQSGIIHASA